MKCFIKYTESYSDIYAIEADSLTDAVRKLDENIRLGNVNGPSECVDSAFEEVSHE